MGSGDCGYYVQSNMNSQTHRNGGRKKTLEKLEYRAFSPKFTTLFPKLRSQVYRSV